MKIRPAGSMMSVYESMAQTTEVADLEALQAYVKQHFYAWDPTDENIQIQPWGLDPRNWWDTYLITVNGHAALFSDGPFPDDSESLLIERLRNRAARIPSDTLLIPLLNTLEEYQRSFELRWRADQRAIKRWRQAHPGNDHIWPDCADLCVWLMDQWLQDQPIP
jgi:hypothetical protein